MRIFGVTLGAILMAVTALPAQAKGLGKNELEICKWGAGVAGTAQQSKLSGTTLYSARNNLKKRKFSKPWMPKMALGITEQTYKSKSKLQPSVVKKTYYDGCIKHELARK
ncbi:hypothetical protein LLY42_24870 [Pseudomonas frederiksbergensis]|uniref:hypothetical protein n=1 Tax=Pseudomonas cucumis TaxID=2954082 RepID=UPI00218C3258|nr:hypothetical protein [Pseudomonas cucumis]URM27056.1 hypothetical protein LLY42_24870 [Pseudomonas frederiksbergensis]WLG92528.1 hypothetical protein PSH72_10790 [Pseudomonas cucumis]